MIAKALKAETLEEKKGIKSPVSSGKCKGIFAKAAQLIKKPRGKEGQGRNKKLERRHIFQNIGARDGESNRVARKKKRGPG